MEEVGDQYFHELLSRSFFQKLSSKRSHFVMHDLVHNLAHSISGEFCIQLSDGWRHGTYENARHLSYYRSEYDAFERFETLTEVKYLRTLFALQLQYLPRSYLSNRILDSLVPKFRYLRVLSLFYYDITEFPDSIGSLKHLRYLDVSFSYIKRLPESICNLYNLQSVILYGCHCLLELPSGLKNLINLRHLNIRDSGVKEMPGHISRLKNLQTLSNFIVGQKGSGSSVGELGGLSQIGRKLHISKLQNVVCGRDASEANLKDKKRLDELVLEWNRNTDVTENGIDVINNLQPHKNVKKLIIEFYGGIRFPNWLGDPSMSSMVSLNLWNCGHCSSLSPLGQLPSLQHLNITGMDKIERVGAEFYGDSSCSAKPFASLETLVFGRMSQWKEWVSFGGEDGAFPRLQLLCIRKCGKLTGELPNFLPSLTKLEIDGCPELLTPVPMVPAICELKILNSSELLLKSNTDHTFSSLDSLEIEVSHVSQLKELPQRLQRLSITKCASAESLLEGMMQNSNCLQLLLLKHCSFSRSLHQCCLPTGLRSVCIYGCRGLQFLLPEFLKCHHPFLEKLHIQGGYCRSFSAFSFGTFPRLTHLAIHSVWGLESLSISISEGSFTALDFLLIIRCHDLVSVELPALKLTHHEIFDCQNLKSLMCTPASFQTLVLQYCPSLSFTFGCLSSSINSLRINNCNKLTPQVGWDLQSLASLTHFKISGGCQDLHSFPKECLLPSTLTSLQISGLPNLSSLDSKGFHLLASLQKLLIMDCPMLQSFPEEGLPTSISFLKISNCPMLKR